MFQGLARDLMGRDALIKPHITTENLAEEDWTVREHQATIIRMCTGIEKVRQSFMPHRPA